MNKQTLAIVAVIAALVAIVLIATTGMNRLGVSDDYMNGTSSLPGGETAAGSREVCYSGSYTIIRATLRTDGSVTGTLDFRPPEKDSLTGTFAGTWQASAMATGLDVVHSYAGEGTNSTERRLIVINDDFALIDWDGPGSIDISDERIPKVACIDSAITTKNYSNSLFGFSFAYPSDFAINSSGVDRATSTAAALSSGTAYVQLSGTESSSGRQQKVELMLQKSAVSAAQFAQTNASKEKISSNGLTWYVSREGMGTSQSIQAQAMKGDVTYFMTGFTFTGQEQSIFSEELKTEMTGIISTFKAR